MPSLRQILNKEGEAIIEDLTAKYIELGMRSSGKWSRSLETEVIETDTGAILRIKGTKYTIQLVEGRKPGRFPPIQAILDWIDAKRIVPQGITKSSLAYLIARKIATEGTDYFKQGGTDLISDVINPARVEKIIEKVGDNYLVELVASMERSFSELS